MRVFLIGRLAAVCQETYGSNPQADDLSWSAMRSFLDDHVGAVTPFHEDATDATMSDTDGTVSESDQQAT